MVLSHGRTSEDSYGPGRNHPILEAKSSISSNAEPCFLSIQPSRILTGSQESWHKYQPSHGLRAERANQVIKAAVELALLARAL